jgi:hypothetical protein
MSVITGLLLLVIGLVILPSSTHAQTIPVDAQAIATVPPALFATWFKSGSPSLNGVVNPANSVAFSNNPSLKNVDFYQWSEQMFLWLTSPATVEYGGGGGRIFSSPTFYDVSPLDSNGNRTFIPHVKGVVRRFNLRAAKPGPHELPVVFSKSGKMFEIVPTKLGPTGKPLVQNAEGKSVEIEKIMLGTDRKPIFQDKKGKTIAGIKPIIPAALINSAVVQQIATSFGRIFLTPSGNVVETEEGQADTNVLVSQNGSLIYYATIVNDVYAYFLTGAQDNQITPSNQFPTTQSDLNKILTFASSHGKTFPDPNALAIEIKTSWIETAGLPNASSYITTTATVPTYNKSNPTSWVTNGEKTVELALLGMHVVGSASGHPEMIWSTFEHDGNSPNASYAYNATSGSNPQTVPQNTSGTWLFCANGATGTFNNPKQSATGANIVSTLTPPAAIAPSNIIRFMPFGGAVNQNPNPLVPDIATSNTQIISMNNSVRGQLLSGDVRKNYLLLGATWTEGGAAPSASFPSGNVVGTSQLANTTMETFTQASSSFNSFNSCFQCHQTNTTKVSHVFPALKKLF